MIEKLGHDDLHFLNIVPMYIHMKTLDLSLEGEDVGEVALAASQDSQLDCRVS